MFPSLDRSTSPHAPSSLICGPLLRHRRGLRVRWIAHRRRFRAGLERGLAGPCHLGVPFVVGPRGQWRSDGGVVRLGEWLFGICRAFLGRRQSERRRARRDRVVVFRQRRGDSVVFGRRRRVGVVFRQRWRVVFRRRRVGVVFRKRWRVVFGRHRRAVVFGRIGSRRRQSTGRGSRERGRRGSRDRSPAHLGLWRFVGLGGRLPERRRRHHALFDDQRRGSLPLPSSHSTDASRNDERRRNQHGSHGPVHGRDGLGNALDATCSGRSSSTNRT